MTLPASGYPDRRPIWTGFGSRDAGTPTGYLVTAAHCVAKSEAAGDVLSDVGGSYIPAELRVLLAQWRRSGVPIDPIITSGLM